MSARYPDSDVMKEVVMKYDSQVNIRDLLEPRENRDVIDFDKESVYNMGGMNV